MTGRVDPYLARIAGLMEEYGWAVQAVFGATPADAFSYTVGLTGKDLPELWLGTLAPAQAQAILNDAAAVLVERGPLPAPFAGALEGMTWGVEFRLRGPCDPEAAQVNVAETLQPMSEVVVCQLLWPDDVGRYPDEDGYDGERYPQRLLPLRPE